MSNYIYKLIKNFLNSNEINRNQWLAETLAKIPKGMRILDAGAGELRNKPFCEHLEYISQDFCQYHGGGNGSGLQTGTWITDQIDIISDITAIPEPDLSFDVILCSEVFEHLPDACKALDEFSRLIKPGGTLIITAPFASLVHFAPYHYVSGFSKYWYEHHLTNRNFTIVLLEANGDWFDYCQQELCRLPSLAKRYNDWCWLLSYFFAGFGLIYFLLRKNKNKANDLACFGWHCIAIKS